MLSHLRESFNSRFTEQKYQKLLKRMDALCGDHVKFRISESPVFLPKSLVRQMEQAGAEIIMQLMSNPRYM